LFVLVVRAGCSCSLFVDGEGVSPALIDRV
jgi:hypothetical protein